MWDANKLTALLDVYLQTAERFAEFITPRQVLVQATDSINSVNAAIVDAAVARFTIGQGQPALLRTFEHAYRAADGVAVRSEPRSQVYDDGPGWVQHCTGVQAAAPPAGK